MHTLTLLFDWILAASARASLLILVVLIVQAFLRHRAPARWRYALWLPVLLVLLMPFFPESPWSLGSIIRTYFDSLTVPVMLEQKPTLTAAAQAVADLEPRASIHWQQVVSLTWLGGAAGMVLFSAGSFVQTLWRFKRAQVPVSDALLSEVAAIARELGLRRTPRVWVASEIRSPAVTGLLHPTLLLPTHFEQTLTAAEAQFVLRHELTHIKRGDLLLNALLCLLLALHWFNPILWLAFFKVRLDREAACDAQVLDREQQLGRVAYGHTLLKMENAFDHHGLSIGFVGIFQGSSELRYRIQSITNQPTSSSTMKTSLSLCIALLIFVGVTDAAPPDINTPQVVMKGTSATQPHAGLIIIPNIHFKNATLTEVAEFLRNKTRELDPEKRGMNIIIKPGVDPKAEIACHLKEVSAHQALRYCAELAGYKLSVDGDIFIISK